MNFFRRAVKVTGAPASNHYEAEDATHNSELGVGEAVDSHSGGDGDGEDPTSDFEETSDGPFNSSRGDSPSPPPPDGLSPLEATADQEELPSGKDLHDEDEESEGDYADDDDSEYTYETDDEEDERPKENGWFGFLRRVKRAQEVDSDNDDGDENGDDESEDEEEDDSQVVSQSEGDDNDASTSSGSYDDEDGDGEPGSEEDGPTLAHSLLRSLNLIMPSFAAAVAVAPSDVQLKKEAEEAILMAQAIRRVRNLYDALSEKDKKLVDALKGVEDEDLIREALARSMEEEEEWEDPIKEGGEAGGSSANGGGKLARVEAVAGKVDGSDEHRGNTVTESSLHPVPSLPAAADYPEEVTVTKVDKPPVLVDPLSSSPEPLKSKVPQVKMEEGHVARDENEGVAGRPSDQHGVDNDYADNEGERPTLEERRSLLTLAAEHNRVDVLQELLNGAGPFHGTLLVGVSSGANVGDMESEEDSVFVPPPLHVAVAHGCVDAVSCLLRIGADPSLRPRVPPAYLARGYRHLERSNSSGSMDEDRNYKKYHRMSAWELAFGSVVVVEGGDAAGDIVEKEKKEEERYKVNDWGWLGFGSPRGRDDKDSKENSVLVASDSSAKKPRIKTKLPLNIPLEKLEGIWRAFAKEASRAICSGEAQRLQQLLNAGMDTATVVSGKTMARWAEEMNCDEGAPLPSDARDVIEGDNCHKEEEESKWGLTDDNDDDDDNNSKRTYEMDDEDGKKMLNGNDERGWWKFL